MNTLPMKQNDHSAFWFFFLVLCVSLTGCTAYQVAGNIKKGRAELLIGDPKVALAHFQRAAELNPDYLLDFTPLPEGVWTYVGRAHYAQGTFTEARKALEEAQSRHPQDNMAKLYLGLVLAHDGERQRGLKEIEAGFMGLKDWLDYMEQYHPDGNFWDPGKNLRKEIQRQLAMLSGKEIEWPKLIAEGQRLGNELEEEIDRARYDQWNAETKDGDDGDRE
jgi:tetratricopeptide (TPR) repeat protein